MHWDKKTEVSRLVFDFTKRLKIRYVCEYGPASVMNYLDDLHGKSNSYFQYTLLPAPFPLKTNEFMDLYEDNCMTCYTSTDGCISGIFQFSESCHAAVTLTLHEEHTNLIESYLRCSFFTKSVEEYVSLVNRFESQGLNFTPGTSIKNTFSGFTYN